MASVPGLNVAATFSFWVGVLFLLTSAHGEGGSMPRGRAGLPCEEFQP